MPNTKKNTNGAPAIGEIVPIDRYDVFLNHYLKSFNIYQSALKAGFAKSTANDHGKRILTAALKRAQQKAELTTQDNETMASKVGLSREEVLERVKFLATQERDLSTAYKVLTALSKEYGIQLTDDDKNTQAVPVLNVVVERNDGSTKPHIHEHTR